MRKLFLSTLILSVSAGCLFLFGCSKEDENKTTVVSQVEEKNYSEVEGTVKSSDSKVITSDRIGKVTINGKVGEEVTKDITLVTFDDGSVLTCPFDKAVITEVFAENGEMVEQGKKLIALSNIDTRLVKADVLENYIKDIKEGALVKIIPNADKSKTYNGKVTTIGNCAVKQSNGDITINVEVSIDNKDEFLDEGYTVSLEINKE